MAEPSGGSLDRLYRATSVAVIGAVVPGEHDRLGSKPVEYLRRYGFAGPNHPLNPNHPLTPNHREWRRSRSAVSTGPGTASMLGVAREAGDHRWRPRRSRSGRIAGRVTAGSVRPGERPVHRRTQLQRIAKIHCAESCETAADLGMQVWGAYGYSTESDVNRHWRDVRLVPIGGGSTQIQKNLIGKLLGLPAAN